MNKREISYKLIKASAFDLEKMANIFKFHIRDYEEVSIAQAEQMTVKIVEMIKREILPDEDQKK